MAKKRKGAKRTGTETPENLRDVAAYLEAAAAQMRSVANRMESPGGRLQIAEVLHSRGVRSFAVGKLQWYLADLQKKATKQGLP